MEKKINDMFKILQKRSIAIFLVLYKYPEGLSTHNLSININSPEGNIINVLYRLEDNGIIVREKVGKSKIIKLTEKGKKMSEHLNKFSEELLS